MPLLGSIYRLAIFLLVFALPLTGVIYAQSPHPLLIESDAPQVIQAGTWSTQPTNAASNGSYLYSSGAAADVLALAFVGSAIEIFYGGGPQFGTLAIEVDGTVLRTVITTSEKIEYGQSTRVDYLSDEPHSLKVYAQSGGIIAVDAFQIRPSSTVEPTSTPSIEDALANGLDDGGIQSSPCAPVSSIYRVVNANGLSISAEILSLSEDGRYIAFQSHYSNIVPGDTNGQSDIFVYDQHTCKLSRVSVASDGTQSNSYSTFPAISAGGRYVVFSSNASNLVPADTNGMQDIFVHDLTTKRTTRVSVSTAGNEGNNPSYTSDISADGRYVVFSSAASNLATDGNGTNDIFLHDRNTTTTSLISADSSGTIANGYSGSPTISADGRYIAFISRGTNLVAGDTNGQEDVFVRDRQTGMITRVSVASGGGQSNDHSAIPVISADGRYIAFQSRANLVANDTNGLNDIFVHDRQTLTTTRVSIATGNYQAARESTDPTISSDGRYITFESLADNLVIDDNNGTYDAFVHDRSTGTTTRLSVAANGQEGNQRTLAPVISGNGRYVTFRSDASNLVPGDTPATYDLFVRPVASTASDNLALFKPNFNHVDLLNTLQDNPPHTAYATFSAYAPITGGYWVMGDWNGDGLDTPGIYANGPFYYTNKSGESQIEDWQVLWIGIAGLPVSGRFNGGLPSDCIGAVQQSNSGGQVVFVLYYTCDLSGALIPTISSQWLSAVLPDSGGFSGAHQFGAGDFDGNGVDSIAVRRGPYIAFGNVAPVTGPATFNFSQYIGAPQPGADTGIFVVGNWDSDQYDSFGLFYQNGEFFFRNDLLFNSGAYGNQSVGTPFGNTGVQATTWR